MKLFLYVHISVLPIWLRFPPIPWWLGMQIAQKNTLEHCINDHLTKKNIPTTDLLLGFSEIGFLFSFFVHLPVNHHVAVPGLLLRLPNPLPVSVVLKLLPPPLLSQLGHVDVSAGPHYPSIATVQTSTSSQLFA